MELSSGYSFRGLDAIRQKGVHYIDTDLPDVVATKKDFVEMLVTDDYVAEGVLEVRSLNVLDEHAFLETVNHFGEGNIVIVNEGLLMYLDFKEKEKLCNIIYNVLKERGGYWITADIYIKNKNEELGLTFDQKTNDFSEEHRIEENKFESFAQAEAFFKCMGFVIDKEVEPNRAVLSTMKYFLKNVSKDQLLKIRKVDKIQTTWRLRIED
jgi:O-methyltransferase involved in polyketide biosynthesis